MSYDCAYIVVTYRRPNGFRDVMRALPDSLPGSCLVVVVDNAAEDHVVGEVERLRAGGVDVTLLRPEGNIGPAGATEMAMRTLLTKMSPDAWIGRLDDDIVPHAKDLTRMLKFAVQQHADDQRVGAVGMVGSCFDMTKAKLMRPLSIETETADVDYVATGHFALFNVRAIAAVGPMKGALFYGLSEVELGLRMRRAGFRIVVNCEMWREGRIRAGKQHWLRTVVSTPESLVGWRRYYSTRNLAHILLQNGAPLRAHMRSVARAAVSPGRLLLRGDISGFLAAELLAVKAIADGYTGKMGRRVEPVVRE